MKYRIHNHDSQKGFTLVELLVVLAIIAILVTMVANSVISAKCEANVTKVRGVINECRTTLGFVNNSAKAKDLMYCTRKAMELAHEMKDDDCWKDNKESIISLWSEFKLQYDALMAEHGDWGMHAIPDDPSAGPPAGYPKPSE